MVVLIYFVQELPRGRVKIGYTARPIAARIAEIQPTTYHPLKLIALRRGNLRTEREEHDRFFYARLTGEWFKPVKELVEYCNEIGVDMTVEPRIPGRKSRTISLGDDDWKALTELANERGLSRSSTIMQLVRAATAKKQSD